MTTSQTTQNDSPKTTRMLLCLIALPICLSCFAALVYSIKVIPRHQKLLASYKSSPGCIASARSTVASSPCTFVNEIVLSKRLEQNSKDPDAYYLTLEPLRGASHEVKVLGYGLWNNAVVGSKVITKNWHGEIVTVNAFSYSAMTPANPYYGSRGDNSDIPAFSVYTLFFAVVFVGGWRLSSPKKSDN